MTAGWPRWSFAVVSQFEKLALLTKGGVALASRIFPDMESEDRKLATAMHVVFEADGDPAVFDNAARSLLASVRRGESDIALRQQAANLQIRLTNRVDDGQCQRVVALAQEFANASRS
jgi:hypothetical protein